MEKIKEIQKNIKEKMFYIIIIRMIQKLITKKIKIFFSIDNEFFKGIYYANKNFY